jgi:hypothetical protein
MQQHHDLKTANEDGGVGLKRIIKGVQNIRTTSFEKMFKSLIKQEDPTFKYCKVFHFYNYLTWRD